MEKSKAQRLIVSITAGAVLLITILVSVLVYQLISINQKNRQVAELEAKIAEYNQLIEESKDVYDARTQVDLNGRRWWIEQRARELGYVLRTDVPLD